MLGQQVKQILALTSQYNYNHTLSMLEQMEPNEIMSKLPLTVQCNAQEDILLYIGVVWSKGEYC